MVLIDADCHRIGGFNIYPQQGYRMSVNFNKLRRYHSFPAVVNGTECEIYNTVSVSVGKRLSGTNPFVHSDSTDVEITLVDSDETPDFITRACEKVIRTEYPNINLKELLPELGIRVIDLQKSDEYSVREADLYINTTGEDIENGTYTESVRPAYWDR